KLLLLCNPHNPAGRLWRRDELTRLAVICAANGVRGVSDEIHCELTAPGTHYTPYGPIDPEAIVCLSPSKAFNTAGLQIANIVCPTSETRTLIDRAININEVCDVNPFGVEALKAAYTDEGEKWLGEVREQIWANYVFLLAFMRERFPQCPVSVLEATYLPWIDISALHDSSDRLEEELLDRAGVWLNSGTMYGSNGYLRINIACSPELLAEALRRVGAALSF
ncbi:MAG: aminotransferase class I/II-fold pyridoxal phosphate-dependent enzyme, partial [Paramuribaculum sp.]|nr:aminotransferase class I/II-fold pyridoxal phosphate-dependent enzyme [Paramuribaculum sp.]